MKLRTVMLIVLLFGSVAWCEAQDLGIKKFNIDSTSEPKMFASSYGLKTIKPLTLDSIVVLWDEYKAECYADSTVALGWPYGVAIIDVGDSLCTKFVIKRDTLRYKHRPVNGFEGFMSFIRRKAGE